MTPLDYVRKFPVLISQYVSSAAELVILIWSATLPDGLKMSNQDLADILHTTRRTVINSISRLKDKSLISNIGTHYHRVLVANGEIISLLAGLNGETIAPLDGQIVKNGVTSSEKSDTNNIKKLKEASSAFMEYWNSKENLPPIRKLTDVRKRKFIARSKDPDFTNNWQLIIDKISRSRFLTGGNGWRADIDWILKNSTNYTKVLEGKYDNNGDDDIVFEDPTPEQAEALVAQMGARI